MLYTDKYLITIINILEDEFNIVIVNQKSIKAVKGKKTDKKYAICITELFKHNLCSQSFILPISTKCHRKLLRYRLKLINKSTSEKNPFQNTLF